MQHMLGCCYEHNHKTLPQTGFLRPGVMQTCKLVGSPKIISWLIFPTSASQPMLFNWANRQNILEASPYQEKEEVINLLRIPLSAARRVSMREGVGSVSCFFYFWSNVYSFCLPCNFLGVFTFRQKHHEISTVIQFITGFMGGIAVHLC